MRLRIVSDRVAPLCEMRNRLVQRPSLAVAKRRDAGVRRKFRLAAEALRRYSFSASFVVTAGAVLAPSSFVAGSTLAFGLESAGVEPAADFGPDTPPIFSSISGAAFATGPLACRHLRTISVPNSSCKSARPGSSSRPLRICLIAPAVSPDASSARASVRYASDSVGANRTASRADRAPRFRIALRRGTPSTCSCAPEKDPDANPALHRNCAIAGSYLLLHQQHPAERVVRFRATRLNGHHFLKRRTRRRQVAVLQRRDALSIDFVGLRRAILREQRHRHSGAQQTRTESKPQRNRTRANLKT